MRGVHASAYLTVATASAGPDHLVPRGRLRLRRQLPARRTSRPSSRTARAAASRCRVLEAVLDVNDRRPDEVLAILERHLALARRRTDHRPRPRLQAGHGRRPRVAGGADRRAAARRRAVVRVHDPLVRIASRSTLEQRVSTLEPDLEDALEGRTRPSSSTRWREYDALPELARPTRSAAAPRRRQARRRPRPASRDTTGSASRRRDPRRHRPAPSRASRQPVRVAMSGAGYMGRGIAHQIVQAPSRVSTWSRSPPATPSRRRPRSRAAGRSDVRRVSSDAELARARSRPAGRPSRRTPSLLAARRRRRGCDRGDGRRRGRRPLRGRRDRVRQARRSS